MTDDKPIWAIVPAAGIGKRMMSPQPKQYAMLHARRVIDYALRALCENDAVAGVVVGVRDDDAHWRAQAFQHPKLIAQTDGGETRAHTVLNALEHLLGEVAADDDWVMVHDAARPCLTQADIARLVAAARMNGDGAVLTAKVTDTLKQGERRGIIEKTLSRAGDDKVFWRALTPQMFRCAALRDALRHSLTSGASPTDESAAMEMSGVFAAAVEGDPSNIKITVPADLALAELFLSRDKHN